MATPASDLDLADLRAERDALREREGELSYRRRLLQGQLDIVRGEGGELQLVDLISDDAPTAGGEQVRALRVEAHEGVDVPGLPDLATLDDAARARLAADVERSEREVSAERRAVLVRLDELQGELVRRYRDEGVDVAGLVGGD